MNNSKSSLSRPRPDAIARSLMPSLDRSQRRRFMPATPSPLSVNNTSSWIWCRSVILSVYSPNEPKSRVFPPNAIQVIGLKWVFKLKRDASGMVTKHKARLVAKGYVQQKGVDFEDVFTLMARMESIQLLLALASKEKWIVHHLDVKSAFLSGELKEEVYVTQPTSFEVKGKEEMVYKLYKSLVRNYCKQT
ncbi:putative RNA-directed DNA polymerase [Tanacetum coccineum]